MTKAAAPRGPSSAKDQVPRLLALLPYLLEHPGARVADVAEAFQVSQRQLVADLGVLWFCGLPGLMPGDYIEVDMDAVEGEGVIYVSNAEFLSRPLRLTAEEALGLLVALRVLRDIAQAEERETIDRVIVRLEEAAGQAANGVGQVVAVQLDGGEDAEIATRVRRAVAEERRLHLEYWVPTRDESTERDVDPMRLVLADGHGYLEAWCRRAEDVRLFRLDRITRAELLDTPASPPPQAAPRDLSDGLFQTSSADALVTVEVESEAAWIAEYYPCETVTDRGDGSLRVQLRVADERWLRRLALRLGDAVRIVDAPELAAAVQADAARALRAYDRPETTSEMSPQQPTT